MVKVFISAATLCLLSFSVHGQDTAMGWYSESVQQGIRIQNSFPKGGPYAGDTDRHYHHSYLVFYTRVANETEQALELELHFSADSIRIPEASDTFVKLFLPEDIMTPEKQGLFSYGVTELTSLEQATEFDRVLGPGEDVLFYVVAVFYQTDASGWNHGRGGNRAELVMERTSLFYRMLPQIDTLPCGRITFLR